MNQHLILNLFAILIIFQKVSSKCHHINNLNVDISTLNVDPMILEAQINQLSYIPVDDLFPAILIDDITVSIACQNLGMTWGFGGHNCGLEIDSVGCTGCNPYKGDTPCSQTLPILCIKKLNLKRPPYPMVCSPHAMTKEFYCGWSGAFLALSKPIQGCKLTSAVFANNWCEATVGCGYKMAEHHDGRYIYGMNGSTFADCTWNWSIALTGGWNLYGYSNLAGVGQSNPPKLTRWWTHINDQNANCWNSAGHL